MVSRYGRTLTERKKIFSKELQRFLSKAGKDVSWIEDADNGVLIVRELLENDSNFSDQSNIIDVINAKDKYNLTPLHHAAMR